VKEAVVSRHLPAGCLLLCALIAPGAATAEAGAQAPPQLNPNTRSIQPGGAGESTAIKSLK